MKIKKFLAISITFVLLFVFGESSYGVNIVFEGINACGKTTIIESFKSLLSEKNIPFCVANELKGSPVASLLKYQKNSFRVSDNETFKTSVYESLLLAAHNHFKQELVGRKPTDKINIFDRDFMTVIAYQRAILKEDYGERFNDFFEPFKKIMLFDLMNVKTVFYVSVPLETSIERIKLRGREDPCSDEQVRFLEDAKEYYEKELIPEVRSLGIDVVVLDGTLLPEENVRIICEKIKV